MAMPFCRPDRILAPTWTLASGTEVGGDYVLAALTDQDPSLPLWIEEVSIGLQGNLGAPVRVDGVAVIHHNFAEGTDVRLRVTDAAGGGGTGATITVTVGPWMGRWAPHLYFDVAAEAPLVGDRTRQYLFLDNTDPNTVPVQIGELVTAGEVETFSGMLVEPTTPLTYGRSVVSGKKGPQFIHDRRSRDRQWNGNAVLDEADDVAIFENWQHQSYGVRPFLCWPYNGLTTDPSAVPAGDEPVYARFSDPVYAPSLPFDTTVKRTKLEIAELSCGEAY